MLAIQLIIGYILVYAILRLFLLVSGREFSESTIQISEKSVVESDMFKVMEKIMNITDTKPTIIFTNTGKGNTPWEKLEEAFPSHDIVEYEVPHSLKKDVLTVVS